MISGDAWLTSGVTLLGFFLSFFMIWDMKTGVKADIQMFKEEVKADIQMFKEEVNSRFNEVNQRFDKVDQRFDNLPDELSTFFEPKKQTK